MSSIALAFEKQSCPENFHCIEIFFIIQDFWATCSCPEKHRVPWIHCIEYIYLFFYSGFWATSACPRKQSCPEIFHCTEIFLSFRIFERLALSLKNRVALKIFAALKYFLSFRIFEQLALSLKTAFALKIFKPWGRQFVFSGPQLDTVKHRRSLNYCKA